MLLTTIIAIHVHLRDRHHKSGEKEGLQLSGRFHLSGKPAICLGYRVHPDNGGCTVMHITVAIHFCTWVVLSCTKNDAGITRPFSFDYKTQNNNLEREIGDLAGQTRRIQNANFILFVDPAKLNMEINLTALATCFQVEQEYLPTSSLKLHSCKPKSTVTLNTKHRTSLLGRFHLF